MQNQCYLGLEIADGMFFAPNNTAKSFWNDTQLVNNGDLETLTSWKFSSVKLPETEDDTRVHVVAKRPASTGGVALDNIRFSTDERCSPRYESSAKTQGCEVRRVRRAHSDHQIRTHFVHL